MKEISIEKCIGLKRVFAKLAAVMMTAVLIFLAAPFSVSAYAATCQHGSCTRKTLNGSRFCVFHTCQKGHTSCKNEVKSANEKCESCKRKAAGSTAGKSSGNTTGKTSGSSSGKTSGSSVNSGKSSGKTNSNSSKKTNNNSSGKTSSSSKKTNRVEMPDCDDYDSYEEFMDDWDGAMPDGSDAEDYWENW